MYRLFVLSIFFGCLAVAGTAIETRAEDNGMWNTPLEQAGGKLTMQVVMVEDEDENPAAAGKKAATALLKSMNGVAPKAVIVSECFEDREFKEELLSGINSVLDRNVVFGAATYGSFTQQGCTDFDSVCLLGIGGDGVGVSAAIVTAMGTARLSFDEHEAEIKEKLHSAGTKLSERIRRTDLDKMLLLIPDAHSPKNQYLVEGVQGVLGAGFPMTGGSANKNAGQTFVYFRGKMYADSAVALMLSGDFRVTMSGRLGQENATVISTAREGAVAAIGDSKDRPLAVLGYNCAGRRSKLNDMNDELVAIQETIGKTVPLFGCYNAGEIGPLDPSEKKTDALCGGSGWHVMFTMIWQK